MMGEPSAVIEPRCTLGEGPLWHPERQRLFWFDIPEGILHSCNVHGDQKRRFSFGEPASAAGWIDRDTLLVATASGLQRFELQTSRWETLVELEADNAVTRSNDGRAAPDGSFWIGTMGRKLERRVGAFYRYRKGMVRALMQDVSIPNATCFSPDGRRAYLADTARQKIWFWSLASDGAPKGDPQVFVDLRDENLNPDGAVCDAEGYLWNAQWGASRLARYAPDGSLDDVLEVPVSQPTCPAFGGSDLKTLFVTSASEGLDQDALTAEPHAGKVLVYQMDVPGLPEHRVVP